MTHDSPIMMSAPMVLACLRQVRGEPGGKTQTRRFPTKQWDALERRFLAGEPVRLWVRENCRTHEPINGRGERVVRYAADANYLHLPEGYGHWDCKPRPSIHMPSWASRLTLLDVTIRREPLGDISEEDARAEGLIPSAGGWWGWRDGAASPTAAAAYAMLWNHLHGPGSWERDRDKQVMVIGFRPVLANIDEAAS